MQTRRGLFYDTQGKKRRAERHHDVCRRKRQRQNPVLPSGHDLFDELPDDIVVCILCNISSSASCPSDLLSLAITCKRFKELTMNPMVLAKASPKVLAVQANTWSDFPHNFLKLCSDSGNLEASYILGMIKFYCLHNRSGVSLMAKAAMGSHAAALYSLAVIQFNGSGGSKGDKDLRGGVALCARAAFLGHVDAMRELGHCLQDGYGIRQNVAEGRWFLIQANARELVAAAADPRSPLRHSHVHLDGAGCPLLSDFGCAIPQPKVHAVNKFMKDWFVGKGTEVEEGLRLCSHGGCGRPETRRHEFRRCSVCGSVNYCSRACQALDWKLRHKVECVPMDQWRNEMDGGDAILAVGLDGGDDLVGVHN